MKSFRMLALLPVRVGVTVVAFMMTLVPSAALAYDGETSPSPTYVDAPPAPPVEDPCGPANARWLPPMDDGTYDFELNPETGELVVTVLTPNAIFTESNDTTFNYGTAPDSGEACDEEIPVPTFSVKDPCGPDNAEYRLPANNEVPYSVVRHSNRSLTVTADNGKVFSNGRKSVRIEPPVDSKEPCEELVKWTEFERNCLNKVFSTAHRGMGVGVVRFGGHPYAEDTWQSLSKGLSLGVCSVETDYWETRDGCIVSHHDPTLTRMTNRTGYIPRKSCNFVTGAVNGGGARVSTMTQNEARLKRTVPRTCFRQQELKGFSVSKNGLKEMVKINARFAKSQECITYTSGMVAPLRFLNQMSPNSTFGLIHRSVYGRPDISKLPGFVDRIMIDYRAVTADYVKRAHKAGKEVSARNVDTPAIYRMMVRKGALVMVTDTPWMTVW